MLKLSHAIVFVSDMQRSIAFYRDVLGLPMRMESPFWTEFEMGQTSIALHLASPEKVPVQPHSTAGACQLGLRSEDLDAYHARLVAAGVKVVSPPTKQDFGASLASYLDPDGLVFTVSGPH